MNEMSIFTIYIGLFLTAFLIFMCYLSLKFRMKDMQWENRSLKNDIKEFKEEIRRSRKDWS